MSLVLRAAIVDPHGRLRGLFACGLPRDINIKSFEVLKNVGKSESNPG
jgi:hypothetical protein